MEHAVLSTSVIRPAPFTTQDPGVRSPPLATTLSCQEVSVFLLGSESEPAGQGQGQEGLAETVRGPWSACRRRHAAAAQSSQALLPTLRAAPRHPPRAPRPFPGNPSRHPPPGASSDHCPRLCPWEDCVPQGREQMAGTETQRPTPRGLLTPAHSKFRRPSVTDWSAPHLNLRSRNNGQKEHSSCFPPHGVQPARTRASRGLALTSRGPRPVLFLADRPAHNRNATPVPPGTWSAANSSSARSRRWFQKRTQRPPALRSSQRTELSPARAQCARPAASPLVTKSQYSTVIKHRSETGLGMNGIPPYLKMHE